MTPSSPRVVGLAGSAGGLFALGEVLAGLPADFPAPVFVVLHLHPAYVTRVDALLALRTALPVALVAGGERAEPGAVYVAPPDRHLLLTTRGTLALSNGPRTHFVRPSADRLFGSLAEHAGPGAIAVVLSGTGVDGRAGAEAVHAAGGTVLAQDEVTSAFFGMPGAAIASGVVDGVLPLAGIAPALVRLAAPLPAA
jgi:two-component system chemotaxis response regulator CheB